MCDFDLLLNIKLNQRPPQFHSSISKMQTIIFLLATVATVLLAIPLNPASNSIEEDYSVVPINDTNSTAQNLYVIRAVVYEIGILTNVDENDTSTNETLTNEQIDLTFFNPDKNGSIIDLGNIPLPVQTNISGHVITGIAPIDLGSISAPDLDSISNLSLSNNLILNATQPLLQLNTLFDSLPLTVTNQTYFSSKIS